MDVAQINSSTWAVSARGLNDQFADKLLVIQDGRSIYTPIDAGVYWDTVDYVLPDLDRIEVIRGPGATLWGSNAVNGVINITSKDARDTQGWLVSGEGSNAESDMSVRYGGKISDDTFYRVYFKGKYDNDLYEPSGASSDQSYANSWYSGRSGFRIDKHPSDADTFTFQGDAANNQLRVPSPVNEAAPPFSMTEVFNGSDTTANVIGRWTHRYNDDSDFSLQVYYDYLKIAEGISDNNQNTFDIDFNDRFKLDKRNEISWGAGYRVYRAGAETALSTSLVPGSQVRNLFSTFVQDKISIVPDRFFLTVGSKLEHNDFTGFEVDPSARLLWTPDKQNSVWAAVSRATRSPSALDTAVRSTVSRFEIPNGSGGTLPAAATIAGDPDFDSEKLVAYELGYRVQATKTLSIDVSTFYNNYTDLRSVELGATQFGSTVIFPSAFANKMQGDTYGGEIAANLQVTANWRLAASYSLLHATFERSQGSNDTTSVADYDGSAPKNQAQLHSYLDITRRLHLNTSLYFTDRIEEYNVPSFISTDINVMWEPIDGMELTVGVNNLADNRHPEFGVTGGQGLSAQVPRTVYGQVTYRF